MVAKNILYTGLKYLLCFDLEFLYLILIRGILYSGVTFSVPALVPQIYVYEKDVFAAF